MVKRPHAAHGLAHDTRSARPAVWESAAPAPSRRRDRRGTAQCRNFRI